MNHKEFTELFFEKLGANYASPSMVNDFLIEHRLIEFKIFHSIKKEYYEIARENNCLKFKSLYKTREINSERRDFNEFTKNKKLVIEANKDIFLRNGLNDLELVESFSNTEIINFPENFYYWIHCWTIEKPTENKCFIEKSMSNICEQLKGSRLSHFGEFLIGPVFYGERIFCNLVDNAFTKDQEFKRENEIRILFKPNDSLEMKLLDTIENTNLDKFIDCKEFLNVPFQF